jgi:hypothetical protein
LSPIRAKSAKVLTPAERAKPAQVLRAIPSANKMARALCKPGPPCY